MTMYGYARVSTRDQDLAAQDSELRAAGCAKVFKEKISGAKTDRPELAKLVRRLEPGDVLVITRLDRLARSTKDLLNVLDEVSKRGAGFRSLRDAWADTTTPHGKLMLTVADRRANRRGPQARQGSRRALRTAERAHAAPAARSVRAFARWREHVRHCPIVRVPSQHHQSIGS